MKLLTSCLVIISLYQSVFADAINSTTIIADKYILAIRNRTDKYNFINDPNEIEYAVFKYKPDGVFDLSWKINSTISSHGFLDSDGKTIALFKSAANKNGDNIFLEIYNKNGLVKKFFIKDIYDVDNLKMTNSSFPLPQPILLTKYFGISHKHDIKMLTVGESREAITQLLNENEEFLYYITSQNKLIIHKLTHGDVIFMKKVADVP